MATILVIDDMDSLREEIIDTLRFEGFQTLGAENGLIGVEMAQKHHPDLILCDVMMPEMDGFAALIALRQLSETATTPFVFLTAKADKTDMRAGMELGADDYLTKPFTTSELIGAIRARLKKHEAVQTHLNQAIERTEARLEYIANHDELTHLPNRLLFHECLKSALARGQMVGIPIALMFLDIDRFNAVNNTLGHEIGDVLFQAIAERIRRFIHACDLVARLRGDEFGIVFSDFSDPDTIAKTAHQLLEIIARPYSLFGHEIFVTASAGITFYPQDATSVNSLIENADMALHHAKECGRNSYKLYSRELNVRSSEHMALENNLRRAIERREFRLFYQPQIDIASHRIVAAEALLRWQHPELGIILPGTFIPLAEETSLILQIGDWVVREAAEQVASWKAKGMPAICVAVNLSGQHFLQGNLVQTITQIVQESGVSFGDLEIELTESIIMQNSDATVSALSRLRALGLQIAIDDFGTGYSSLSYLKHFPVTALKVDRCFVSGVTESQRDAAIAIAVLDLARSLNLRTIAEGVETQEQFNFLKFHGCDRIQGYLYSPPVPAEEFERMMQQQHIQHSLRSS